MERSLDFYGWNELIEETEKYGNEIWESVNSFDLSDFPSDVKTEIQLDTIERLYS